MTSRRNYLLTGVDRDPAKPWSLNDLAASEKIARWNFSDTDSISTGVGNLVTGVTDLFPNGYDLEQGSSSKQPETNTRDINGFNVLDFDADFLENTADQANLFPVGKKIFVFTIVEFDTSGGVVFYAGDSAGENGYGGSDILEAHFGRNTSANPLRYVFQDNASSGSKANFTGSSPSNGTPILLACEFNRIASSEGMEGWLDAVTDGSATISETVDQRTCSIFHIGQVANQSRGINGKIGEVVMVADISSDTRQLIEGEMCHRWLMSANLPVGHPYKDAAP